MTAITGAKFCSWVNNDLLPTAELQPGCPQQIQPRTATKWLHCLGFQPQSHKKSVYIDGHEQDDVVEYRKLYLRKLEILSSTHLPPPCCDDSLIAIKTGNPSATKHLVLGFHDESSFHANEAQSTVWAEEGRVPIRPKNQGRRLMVSDFVTEFDGLLQLTTEEYRRAAESDQSIRMCAREIINSELAVRVTGTMPGFSNKWRAQSILLTSSIPQIHTARFGYSTRAAATPRSRKML